MSKQVLPNTTPSLFDLLLRTKRESAIDINCVKIGIIESYTALTNSASVRIASKILLANGEIKDYPLLDDCPVIHMQGGGASITMPIEQGDHCIVLFNDRNIDSWYTTGAITTPDDNRLHSIADGIVLVGLNPITEPVLHSTSCVTINGATNKVAIKNNATDLKTLITNLTNLVQEISDAIGLMTFASNGAPPNNINTFTGQPTSISTKLTTLKTNIATLLDEGTI